MSNHRIMGSAMVAALLITVVVSGQEKQPANDEVIRITTELVQTGVIVLDKQGRFVPGLTQEQFIFKVDGQPVTPTFFEHVVAGTVREEKLERAGANRDAIPKPDAATASYRGRTIIFFIDDLHLGAESVQRTRKAILDFVDQQMSLEDQVAVVSASGQIGFLQRLSDLKPVVRAAVNRLTHKPYTVRDNEQIKMTEYQAIRIEQGDTATSDYFANELIKATNVRVPGGLGPPAGGPVTTPQRQNTQTAGMNVEMAKRVVKDRANFLLRQTEAVTSGTLTSLESLMRSVSQIPGRKVVFLITDGFFLNDRATGYANKIRRIVNAAVHGGLVVYSLDARGLTGTTDAGSNRADPLGQLAQSSIGEVAASQDGMNALAVDTGGKAFFGAALTTAVNDALKETSNYYLLAWRPTTEDQKSPNFRRLEVSIVGRPDLTVRLPRGFFVSEPKDDKNDTASKGNTDGTNEANPVSKSVETALVSALAAPSARTGIPTKLSVSFVDVPGTGPVMTAATQMTTDVLSYGAGGNEKAEIDLAGVVLNEQGKQAGSFKTRINISPSSQGSATRNPAVVYSHKIPLKAGIYQIRVAARDDKSGRVGSDAQWIEIPDLSAKKLTLSTLLLGGNFISNDPGSDGQKDQVQFSVDRRFTHDSQMTFLTLIYNAGGGQLDSQIEILRGGQRVIASPVRPITIEPGTDLARIPYGGGVALKTLAPGRYVLKVTVTDRNANASAVSQILFEVE